MANEDVRIHAPEFDGAIDWFNVDRPLTLKQLRGKVVLLDFWTYGCVNCMHVLPDLKRLEQKYGHELVIVGVHSAKFTNERKSDNIRRILVRYEIEHPVANDANFAIWKAYGARAWPTQVLIDPEGYVVATASGEGKGEAFDQAIAAVIHFFDEQGKIDRTPPSTSLRAGLSTSLRAGPSTSLRAGVETSTLAFPGKVLADEAGGRLFIADSNHNRVLVASLDGRVTTIIGDGGAGFTNGAFSDAQFFRPQGMALDGDRLYIADTENHVVRMADLTAGRVSTFAGTGKQAMRGGDGGAAREIALSSPWDLAIVGRLLFVAMAGTHQIWLIDLDRKLAFPYAGSGREARVDGTVDEAAFAQSSGLAVNDAQDTLFAADAESNVIRAVDLPPTNRVRTLAGGDLFEFGDRDGRGDAVRLQHPLGVVWSRGRLFIADTYNHKIKALDPATGDVQTFAGRGDEGHNDGESAGATFYEPGGISATSDKLYVADTNNHAIRVISLATGRVDTIQLTLPK